MPAIAMKELLEAGAHFGHQTKRWNPKMRPYIYGTRNQIHIIDIRQTIKGLLLAKKFVQKVVSEGKDVRSIAAALAPQVDRIFTTRCAHPRAVEPGDVAAQLVGLSCPVMPAGAVEEALPLAREGEGTVIVAGSLFLVGAVRDLVGA